MNSRYFKLNVVIFMITLLLLCSCPAKAQSASDPVVTAFSEAGLQLLRRKASPKDFPLLFASIVDEEAGAEAKNLADFKGKVVFLNFWATWCGPCRVEMPSMEVLYNRHRENGLEILAVNAMEKRADVLEFMKNNGFSFPALLDESGKVGNSYGIKAIPTTFLIDRDGNIIMRLVGSINWDTPSIHAAIETLLSQ